MDTRGRRNRADIREIRVSFVYIDFPEENTEITAGESAGQMESVKTVGEIIMPLSATILEVNPEVQEDTSILNDNSENTWLLKVKLAAGQ